MRSDISKSFSKINEEVKTYPIDEVVAQQARLKDLLSNIKEADNTALDELVEEGADEAAIQAEYDKCVLYTDKLQRCIALLQNRSDDIQTQTQRESGSTAGAAENSNSSKLKLPQVQLPSYGHKEGEDLSNFFLNFENILAKNKFSDYEKFVYLQNQLNGEPLSLIKSLDVSSQSYTTAKELLTKAFASKITQQFENIKRLSNLKFVPRLPYEYLGKLRQIKETFGKLEITTDVIMQYFFWNSMPESLQQHFIHITGSNRPTLKQISEHMFTAMERYMEMQKKLKVVEPPDVNTLAISMERFNKPREKEYKQYCSLCSTTNYKVTAHSTYNCDKYQTSEAKIKRLKERNACLKCGNLTHETTDCKFRFKHQCAHCSKYHFSYLCNTKGKPEPTSKDKKFEKKDFKKVNAACTWVAEASLGVAGQDSIMPTFTCDFKGEKARILYDSGSQACFITDALADKLSLKTIEMKSGLNINGFNSSNKMDSTRIVELRIDEHQYPISLICVPSIRISMHLPGLEDIAKIFESKGYKLADELLSTCRDYVGNISIVLGNNESHVLPQSDHKFGPEPASMYSSSPKGILLKGSVARLEENLKHLPHAQIDSSQMLVTSIQPAKTLPKLKEKPEQSFEVIKNDGKFNESILDHALKAAINSENHNILPHENEVYEEEVAEIDRELVSHVIDTATRSDSGRLVMSMMWNSNVSHMLGNNFSLSKAILNSVHKKLKSDPQKLLMYDTVFKQQESDGIIERIPDIKTYLSEHPSASFIAHMGVFKMTKESTKCRIVYLSNLVDKRGNPNALSHNQVIMSGPCLNKKITTAVCELRFDRYLLCFDLIKAFLNIELYPEDQTKLLLLWYKNVAKNDFSIVAYKHVRLAFGLRCSPAILTIAMYIILIANSGRDEEDVRDLKALIYSLIYVDNGAVTYNDKEKLQWAYNQLNAIFNPYQFYLQQFNTNDMELQSRIDQEKDIETPKVVGLFGLDWHRENDTLSTHKMSLDPSANNMRKMLSSIASNFDPFQINGPILNRARMFLHSLQCDQPIDWDKKRSDEELKEWVNICTQVNKAPPITIPRCVGRRNDAYNLVACTDASKHMYGAVLYLENESDGTMSFLAAKNRIVSKQLERKTIPCLEFHAISLGAEMIMEYYEELSGEKTITPTKIRSLKLCTDSAVALNWLYASYQKLDKLQKVSPFVKNRLAKIVNLCEKKPIEFRFVAGKSNPADCITRCLSHKQLMATNYFEGPNLNVQDPLDGLSLVIPREDSLECGILTSTVGITSAVAANPIRCATLSKLLGAQTKVLRYINILKERVNKRCSWNLPVEDDQSLNQKAWDIVLQSDQRNYYKEEVNFFQKKSPPEKEVPPIIKRLNVYLDDRGTLRVQSKFERWSKHNKQAHPILLAKDSRLTRLMIEDAHRKKCHSGVYSVLSGLLRTFYIPHQFSTVKKVLKDCIPCRRVNKRAIKVSQNGYRDFRVTPPNVPFRYIFVDHFGPYFVKVGGTRKKVWVLIITCLWSRAINLKLCHDLTVAQFLRALQSHIYEFGHPELMLSDSGSQIVAGSNVIKDMMKDAGVGAFLRDMGTRPMDCRQYAKGNPNLGGLVESCVKISKRLINGCIRNQALDIFDFMFTLDQVRCIANKRPIAFKEGLRDSQEFADSVPSPITPEVLIRGHDLVTMNILPVQSVDIDPDWNPESDGKVHIKSSYEALCRNRERLVDIYQNEFLSNLTRQATDAPDRYRKVGHEKLEIGDLVLLKEPHTKCVNFPMGIVRDRVVNSAGEVTEAVVTKGNGERVKRHVTSLILLLRNGEQSGEKVVSEPSAEGALAAVRPKARRQAAVTCRDKLSHLSNEGLL